MGEASHPYPSPMRLTPSPFLGQFPLWRRVLKRFLFITRAASSIAVSHTRATDIAKRKSSHNAQW